MKLGLYAFNDKTKHIQFLFTNVQVQKTFITFMYIYILWYMYKIAKESYANVYSP